LQPTRSEKRRTRSLAKTRAMLCSFIDRIEAAGLWQYSQVSLFGFSQVSFWMAFSLFEWQLRIRLLVCLGDQATI